MSKKTLRSRAKTGFAVLGAAAFLVVSLDAGAYAASGNSLFVGKLNKETKTTTIQNTKTGPALTLKTKAGQPPLAVGSATKVGNLNADLLDGLDSSAFASASAAAAASAAASTASAAASSASSAAAQAQTTANSAAAHGPIVAANIGIDGNVKSGYGVGTVSKQVTNILVGNRYVIDLPGVTFVRDGSFTVVVTPLTVNPLTGPALTATISESSGNLAVTLWNGNAPTFGEFMVTVFKIA